jgi:hypothetical protein
LHLEGGAGLLLLRLARVVCWPYLLALLATCVAAGGSWSWGLGQCWVAAAHVSAGFMLPVFFITISHCAWRHFISWSFARPATKKRSKENAFPQSELGVPSVQITAFGSRVERCSLEPPTLEPLLLANSYIPTLRHQCSRARSASPGPTRPHASLCAAGLRNPRAHLGQDGKRANV